MNIPKENPIGILSGSTLKIIACVLMAIDHIGLILFPSVLWLRAIGRLAFPLFAYFIAEGCKYTRHRLKRFLTIFSVGLALMLFYFFWDGTVYGNIFMTFSISVALIYLLDFCKRLVFVKYSHAKLVLAIVIYLAAAVGVYGLTKLLRFDYGFFGAFVPVFVSLFDFHGLTVPRIFSDMDNYLVRAVMLAIALLPLCIGNVHGKMNIFGFIIPVQWFCLGSVILVLLYNGKPGIRQLKYAFYLFYPLHLIIIEGIYLLINLSK